MVLFTQATIPSQVVGGFDLEVFVHGAYVAFTFAVLLFGALAFRQVLDNLEVKRLMMGEDRDAFIDAPGAIFMGICWFVALILCIVMYGIVRPSVYSYALPLVFMVQIAQISMRLQFQRTLVKTRGIVVRSVLLARQRTALFDELVMVRMVKHSWWVDVRLGLQSEEIGFRIFAFSAPSLERMLSASSTAPILWIAGRSHPPSTTV